MSYIDDLNQAASEALAASASATESSQIIYDVANGDENTTVTTANGEVKTLAKAIADITAELKDGTFSTVTEEVVLSAGQTEVTLTSATTNGMQLYVEGVREFDFTINSEDSFSLSEALPDGTRIWVVGVEFGSSASTSTVTSSQSGVSKTLADWTEQVLENTGSLEDAGSLEVDAGEGTSALSLSDRFGKSSTLYDYGAIGDGTSDDSAAASAYIADWGRLDIPRGGFNLGTFTIEVPLSFASGGYITASSGNTITIQNSVNSCKQYIFRGDCDYALKHDSSHPLGQMARFAHVSWFGIFPSNSTSYTDMGPLTQKMTDSMDNTRESYIMYDTGVYWYTTGVMWNRASNVIGMGNRLTNIQIDGDLVSSGDVFGTNGVGCQFRSLQFNSWNGYKLSGAYIRLSHERCETYDIYMDEGFDGIVHDATECKSIRTKGLTWSQEAGTSVIKITQNNCYVSDVSYSDSSDEGPEQIVLIQPSATSLNYTRIRDVHGETSGDGVKVNASLNSVNTLDVKGVMMESGGWGFSAVLDTSSNSSVWNVGNITMAGGTTGGVNIELTSTGHLYELDIAGIAARNGSDTGIRVHNTSTGRAYGVVIGSHTISATQNGVYVSGSGTAHEDVSMTGGVCRNCEDGYELGAKGLSAFGLSTSGCTTGYRVTSNSSKTYVRGVSRLDSTKIVDASTGNDINIF